MQKFPGGACHSTIYLSQDIILPTFIKIELLKVSYVGVFYPTMDFIKLECSSPRSANYYANLAFNTPCACVRG
jgi:hypothetical protein